MDATTIVLLLITLVSACIAIVWAYKAERRIDLLTERMDARQKDVSRHEGKIVALEQRPCDHYAFQVEAMDCIGDHARELDRLNGRYGEIKGIAHEARQKARQCEERQKELEKQVAGMQVSREVLTPSRVALGSRATGSVSGGSRYGFLPDPPLPEPTFTATAYVDGGRAATDEPLAALAEWASNAEFVDGFSAITKTDLRRWRTETASDPAGFDLDPETAEAQPQPDDDQATAVNDVQAVEEWDEAKRGEVA